MNRKIHITSARNASGALLPRAIIESVETLLVAGTLTLVFDQAPRDDAHNATIFQLEDPTPLFRASAGIRHGEAGEVCAHPETLANAILEELRHRGKIGNLDSDRIMAAIEAGEAWAVKHFGTEVHDLPYERCREIARQAMDEYYR